MPLECCERAAGMWCTQKVFSLASHCWFVCFTLVDQSRISYRRNQLSFINHTVVHVIHFSSGRIICTRSVLHSLIQCSVAYLLLPLTVITYCVLYWDISHIQLSVFIWLQYCSSASDELLIAYYRCYFFHSHSLLLLNLSLTCLYFVVISLPWLSCR